MMRPCTALRVLWIGLALWITGALPASSATRSVLLLYDERVDLPGLAALNSEFINTLLFNSTDPIEIYREEMDLSRFGSDTYGLLLQDFLRAKYSNKRIDVAVAVLGPALDFLLARGSAIFPGASVVFCGVDRKDISNRTLPPNVHGILLKREFAPTLELALQIHPQTTHVVVVGGHRISMPGSSIKRRMNSARTRTASHSHIQTRRCETSSWTFRNCRHTLSSCLRLSFAMALESLSSRIRLPNSFLRQRTLRSTASSTNTSAVAS